MTETFKVSARPWSPGQICLIEGDPFSDSSENLAIISTREALELIKTLADSIEGATA